MAAAETDLLGPPAVSVAGRPLARTVLFCTRWLAGHERTHVKQVARNASAMRSEHASGRSG